MHLALLLVLATGCLIVLSGLVLVGGVGDAGDGLREVHLPQPQGSLRRVTLLVGAVLACGILVEADGNQLASLATAFAGRLLLLGGAGYGSIAAYDRATTPLLGAFLVSVLFAFQLARRNSAAGLAAGIAICCLVGATVVVVTAAVAGVSAAAGIPPGATVYLTDLCTLFVGLLGFVALMLRTAALPRRYLHRSFVPCLSSGLWVTGIALVCLLVGVVGFHLISGVASTSISYSPIAVFLVVPVVFSLYEITLFAFRPKPAAGTPARHDPPIDVIMPAWDEEDRITETLRSIERAALRYPGAIRILVADDGSTDSTVALVEEVASASRSEMVVLRGPHAGKSQALNRALEAASADVVVRIDADIVVGDNVFNSLPAWFANPSIGCVGAFDLPNFGLPAWYTKGRLLECLYTFGFSRLAFERFDANNIPGTFMAFRREEALALGGFVEGMNGEDSDLTFNLGRLGLKSVIDTSILIYEDVPQTYEDFVKQRTRWARASVHVAARHLPRSAAEYSGRYAVQLRFLYNKLSTLLRPVTYLAGASLVLGAGHGRDMVLRGLLLLAIGFVPQVAVLGILMTAYGYGRHLAWLALWLPFTIVRKIGMLNGLLSIPPCRRETAASSDASLAGGAVGASAPGRPT